MSYNLRSSLAFIALCFHLVAAQSFNPTILQDSRDLPKTDGTFGFLYRTEDGIAHAAKGDSNGVIHGRFSYTDPTGLKVNYNYNAGSRVTPGYDYDATPAPLPQPQYESRYTEAPQYAEAPQNAYEEPLPAPLPRPRARPRYSAQYREPIDVYQQRRTRPPLARPNEFNDGYN